MRCPNCNKSISIFKAKNEFTCPQCRSLLKCDNYLKDFFKSTAPYVLIGFFIDMFVGNIAILAIVDLVIFMLMMSAFSNKIDCHAAQSPSSRNDNA